MLSQAEQDVLPPPVRGDALVMWRLLDGRPGHENQVFGLTEALARQAATDCHDIRLTPRLRGLNCLLPGRLSEFSRLPRPDLIVAAGHGTHLPLLRLQRRFGGRTIVLMKPSLPLGWFDLCLVPAGHHFSNVPSNVILTAGAVNRMVPSPHLDPHRGLILVGGPSTHFQWSTERVLEQIADVIRLSPDTAWTVTTSRRTPADFQQAWLQTEPAAELHPWPRAQWDWVVEQLGRAGTVWVSMDSVSMIFEALTAGANVGLLELSPFREDRVTRGINALLDQEQVIRQSAWRVARCFPPRTGALDEGARCAAEILRRFEPVKPQRGRP